MRAFRRSCLMLFALGLAAARPSATAALESAQPRRHVLPMLYDYVAMPVPVVYVRVNGGTPLPFAVDTGYTEAVVLFSWAAERLKLPQAEPVKDAFGTQVEAIRVESLAVMAARGSAPLRLPVKGVQRRGAPLWDGYGRGRIAGLIGAAALADYAVRFDFENGRMTCYEGPPDSVNGGGARTVPLRKARNPADKRLAVNLPASAGGEPFPLIVDTGAGVTVLPGFALRPLAPAAPRTQTPAPKFGDSGGVTEPSAALYFLASAPLGVWREPGVAALEVQEGRPYGFLGVNVLGRYEVTLDFPAAQMRLRKRRDYGALLKPYGVLPFDAISWEAGAFVMTAPVSEAVTGGGGLSKGDRVIAVDGRDLRGWRMLSAGRLLNGFAATQAVLVVERTDRPGGPPRRVTVRVKRAPYYSPPTAR